MPAYGRKGREKWTARPLGQMIFLPQRPYMIIGTLRDQLVYPRLEAGREIPDSELLEVLQAVNLPDLAGRVGGLDIELDWADILSLGEQQRLAFARLMVNRPRVAVLDEATSALDLHNEEELYKYLRESGIRYISVGHRSSLIQYHQNVLELEGDTSWRLLSAADYTDRLSVEAEKVQEGRH